MQIKRRPIGVVVRHLGPQESQTGKNQVGTLERPLGVRIRLVYTAVLSNDRGELDAEEGIVVAPPGQIGW